MLIRKYKSSDCATMAKLFYDTVHIVNAKDYTKEQLNVWATGSVELEIWDQSFREHTTLIAEFNEEVVGFGDMDDKGYLDRLYIHKDFQGMGIAAALVKELEKYVGKDHILFYKTYASITAKPFFEKQGYVAQKENQVIRNGISLINYEMIKKI